jgi:tetratricopeptide (TPR) repeat protein
LALLGDAYWHFDQLAEARRCFSKAVQLNDRSPVLRRKLGDVYLRENKFALALEQLRAAADLGATGGELRLAMAVAHLRLGNLFGETRVVHAADRTVGDIVRDAYLIEPIDSRPGAFLAAPPDSAIYQAERALDEGLDTIDVHLLRAEIWSQARQYTRAAELYAFLQPRLAQSSLSPRRQAEIHMAHAEALYGADDLEGYLAQLTQAARLDAAHFAPRMAQGYEKAAARCNQRGDLGGYIRYLELAVAESPHVAEWHYRLGNGYWEAGQKRPAARHWRIALQIAPDHADRARMLELIQRVDAPPR